MVSDIPSVAKLEELVKSINVNFKYMDKQC